MVCESIDHGNNVMMAYLFLFFSLTLIFQDISLEMDVKNHQIVKTKMRNNNFFNGL